MGLPCPKYSSAPTRPLFSALLPLGKPQPLSVPKISAPMAGTSAFCCGTGEAFQKKPQYWPIALKRPENSLAWNRCLSPLTPFRTKSPLKWF